MASPHRAKTPRTPRTPRNAISLRVGMPDGSTRNFRFTTESTVGDACREIMGKVTIDTSQAWGLFAPEGSAGEKARWLRMDRTISFYEFENGADLIFMRKKRSIRVQWLDGSTKTFIVDESLTVQGISMKFGRQNKVENPEEYSLKVLGSPDRQWLNPKHTLHDSGVDDKSVLVFKRKYYFDPQKPDKTQPRKLHAIYQQAAETVHRSTFNISRGQCIQLAAIECLAEFGEYDASKRKNINPEQLMPEIFQKSKPEKAIAAEWEKLPPLASIDAKYQYIFAWRTADGWGTTSFDVSIKTVKKGKAKFRPALLGLSKHGLTVFDPKTREITEKYPISDMKRWASGGRSVAFEFNTGEEFTVESIDKDNIIQLLIGYIGIIRKKNKERKARIVRAESMSTRSVGEGDSTDASALSPRTEEYTSNVDMDIPDVNLEGMDDLDFDIESIGDSEDEEELELEDVDEDEEVLEAVDDEEIELEDVDDEELELMPADDLDLGELTLDDETQSGLKGLREAAETYQQLLGSGDADILVMEGFNLNTAKRDFSMKCNQANRAICDIGSRVRSGEWGKANEVAADVATLLDEVSVLAQEIVVTDRTQQHLLQLAGGIMEAAATIALSAEKFQEEEFNDGFKAAFFASTAAAEVPSLAFRAINQPSVITDVASEKLVHSISKAAEVTVQDIVLKSGQFLVDNEELTGTAELLTEVSRVVRSAARSIGPTLKSHECVSEFSDLALTLSRAIVTFISGVNGVGMDFDVLVEIVRSAKFANLQVELLQLAVEAGSNVNDMMGQANYITSTMDQCQVLTNPRSSAAQISSSYKIASQSAGALVNVVKGMTDANMKNRLMQAAKQLAAAVRSLFQAAKAAAQKPQDRQVRVQLIKVAQALQKATELYRTKMVQKLASAALTHHAKVCTGSLLEFIARLRLMTSEDDLMTTVGQVQASLTSIIRALANPEGLESKIHATNVLSVCDGLFEPAYKLLPLAIEKNPYFQEQAEFCEADLRQLQKSCSDYRASEETTDLEETVAEVAKTREKGVTLKALQDAINAVKAAAEKYLAKSRLGRLDANQNTLVDQASGITQLMQDLMLAASLLEEEIHQEMELEGGVEAEYDARIIACANGMTAATLTFILYTNRNINGEEDAGPEIVLAAASKVAASTVQIVTHSRVKAKAGSTRLSDVEQCSFRIKNAVDDLSKHTKRMLEDAHRVKNVSLDTDLSAVQKHRQDLEAEAKIIKLEMELESARKRVHGMRKQAYASGEAGRFQKKQVVSSATSATTGPAVKAGPPAVAARNKPPSAAAPTAPLVAQAQTPARGRAAPVRGRGAPMRARGVIIRGRGAPRARGVPVRVRGVPGRGRAAPRGRGSVAPPPTAQ